MKAVFLDRDGVLNDNNRPINRPVDLVLYPWVYQSLTRLKAQGYKLFVVTNQGGIAGGYFTHRDLNRIHDRLNKNTDNIIDEIVYCPHLGNRCDCRKPKPGMLNKLIKKYDINKSKSYMIGDRDVDILAGNSAGVTTIKLGEYYRHADYTEKDLYHAVNRIETLSSSDNEDSTDS